MYFSIRTVPQENEIINESTLLLMELFYFTNEERIIELNYLHCATLNEFIDLVNNNHEKDNQKLNTAKRKNTVLSVDRKKKNIDSKSTNLYEVQETKDNVKRTIEMQ